MRVRRPNAFGEQVMKIKLLRWHKCCCTVQVALTLLNIEGFSCPKYPRPPSSVSLTSLMKGRCEIRQGPWDETGSRLHKPDAPNADRDM